MVRRTNTKNFYADVDISVRESFAQQWKERGLSNNTATTAALKLWISLPREVQGIILHFPDEIVESCAQLLARNLKEDLSIALSRGEQSGPIQQAKQTKIERSR